MRSLTARLTLSFLLLSLVPIAILGLASAALIERAIIRQAADQLEALADVQQGRLAMMAEHHTEELALVASRVQLRVELGRLLRGERPQKARQFIESVLREILASVHDFDAISVLDPRGRVVASTDPAQVGRDLSGDPAFQHGRTAYSVNTVARGARGDMRFRLAAPLDLDGRKLGVLLMVTGSEELTPLVQDRANLGETGETVLARKGADGQPELLTPLRFEGPLSRAHHPPIVQALEAREGFYDDAVDYRGQPVLAATRYVRALDWALVVKIDRAEAYAPVRQLRLLVALAALASVVLVALVGYAASVFVTRPLHALTTAADALASGDLSRRAPVLTDDDIGVLAKAFNRMADSVQAANATLEARVAERTAALERARSRLEQFASVASHDLKEPLRTVRGFADLLSERCAGLIDPDARTFLGYIQAGVSDMALLVDDLLAWARLGESALGSGPASAQDALDEALADLREAMRESGAQVTSDPLPVVLADHRHLRRVFLNLLGNALKFRGDRPPRVHVSARRDGDRWTVSVRDNGIGIEDRYCERIFEPLKRLHPRSQYPGTGLGLAVCRQIVDMQGGRIWVDSSPGEGSTFCFTVTAAP